MSWLFPFNLLSRISSLELENAALRSAVKDLNNQLAAERISQCSMTAAYVASAASMAATYQQAYRARAGLSAEERVDEGQYQQRL